MTKPNYKLGDHFEYEMPFLLQEQPAGSNIPDGFISGIASTPNLDLHGHKVVAGAFDDSIRAKGFGAGPGVKLLMGHDWQKIAGKIHSLNTINDNLRLEAQMFLSVSYVKDLYEVIKGLGGLSFSVGFKLQEFDIVEEDPDDPLGDYHLLIKRGDLMEVSIVTFPAQPEAELTFIKHGPYPKTLTEFEKAMVAEGYCRNRTDAHKFTLAVKNSLHLFQSGKAPPGEDLANEHPWLDVTNQLMASHDLTTMVKSLLSHSPT